MNRAPAAMVESGDASDTAPAGAGDAPPPSLDILSKMNAKTVPSFGMILPTAQVPGNVGMPTRIEGLLWEAKGTTSGAPPKKRSEWSCHPFDPTLLPLQKLAGIKQGDSPENLVMTLHFVLSSDVSGIALHRATVGPSTRDSRYAQYMGDQWTAADLVRSGLIPPTTLPPLEVAAAVPAAERKEGDAEDGGKAKKDEKEATG